ncbi:thiamine biosynthesis lipoprotein [Natronincola peptidivorans]|uniref:FAD:protein FMN transferase n=1 Tax=Natronincola peptidivorans TaxID=426128 RepID=A0A1I0D4V2_9FIRM|nr:FAD:protein FMN transferase [Natronincola peptidivorans]SET27049.1 thiamine biosynthesis lipoprotein [Natronincola peptidivorans]
MKIFIHRAKTLLLLLMVSFILISCSEKPDEVLTEQKEQQFVLNTLAAIQIYSPSDEEGNRALSKAYQRVHQIENSMSITIEDSDIYKLNEKAGIESVKVSDETLQVLKSGIDFYELTDGTFNIGLGTLIELWRKSIEASDSDYISQKPSIEEVQWAKNHVDLQQLEIDGSKVYIRDPHMMINLGGIAKGYAVDEAARILKEEGIKSGYVNFGGDIYVMGPKPDGSPWRMGIQNPTIGVSDVIASIELVNKSIVSSGNYERFFIDEETGEHYHHIIDSETGYPTANELVSVSIISNTSMEGDVFSTATFVMGLEEGLHFIESLPDVEGIFVTKDQDVYVTSGIRDSVRIADSSFRLAN